MWSFFSFFYIKIDIQGQKLMHEQMHTCQYNHNIQFLKIKFQNNFRPIANKVFKIILHLFFLYKQ